MGGQAARAAILPGARYAFFGFGDRHYLMARSHDGPELLAALWPGAGLILVTTLANTPTEAFGAADVVELPLTHEEMREVQDFIGRSIASSGQGIAAPAATAPLEPGPYEGSLYFAAVPRYSAVHTCITWAAEALRAGGLPIRARLTVVAGQLWRQVRKLEGASQASRSVAGRRVAVLAHDRGAAALGDHDRGLCRRRGTAAADAAGQ